MAAFYWRGSAGRFDSPAGWQTLDATGALTPADDAPADGDTVLLDTAPMILNGDADVFGMLELGLPGTLGGLDLNGHRLVLAGTAQLGGPACTIGGPGGLETDAVSWVPPAVNGDLALRIDDTASWINNGLVMAAGAIALHSGGISSAALTNSPGAVFAFTADGDGLVAAGAGGGSQSVENAGTLVKLAGSGTTRLDVPIANSGVVVAATGTLELNAGGVLGGTFGGGDGEVHLAGTFCVPAGTVASVSFDSGAQLGAAEQGAAVVAGSGTVASTGTVRVTDGGAAQLLLAGGAAWINGGTMLLQGVLGFGQTIGDGATLVNQVAALIDLGGHAGFDALGSTGASTLVNFGTITRSGEGLTRIEVPVTNFGSIAINTGTLDVAAGGSFAGTISGGGVLAFDGGVAAVAANACVHPSRLVVSGATLVQAGSVSAEIGLSASVLRLAGGELAGAGLAISSGSTVQGFGLIAGPVTDSGLLECTGGTLALDAGFSGNGLVQIDAGSLLQLGPAACDASTLTDRGTIGGGGIVTISGSAALIGALQTGPGTMRLLGAASLGGGMAFDGGYTLANSGWLTWSSGNVLLGGGDPDVAMHSATLSNSGVLCFSAGGSIGPVTGGKAVLDNAGVISVSAGLGKTKINAALLNSGVVRVDSGTLRLDGAVQGSGLFDIRDAARLDFASVASGEGSIRFLGNDGTLQIEQPGSFGSLVWGFGSGDLLDFTAITFAAHPTVAFATGILTLGDGVHGAALRLAGSYDPAGFWAGSDGHGGTAVHYL